MSDAALIASVMSLYMKLKPFIRERDCEQIVETIQNDLKISEATVLRSNSLFWTNALFWLKIKKKLCIYIKN